MTFVEDGFTVARQFLPNIKGLYEYTMNNKKNGMLDDSQVPDTPSFYNDEKMNVIHNDMLSKVEDITKLKLFKTYNYYRTYKKGDILRIHKDRPACEISVTVNLGFEGKNWPLWIMNYNEEAFEVLLEPGDGVVYRGCELNHWRGVNKYAKNYSQVFLHYVDQNGPFSWAKDDGK